MEIPRITWQLFSGLLALIPIAMALRAFPKDKLLVGTIVAFLSIGVMTDCMMWVVVRSGDIHIATRVFQFYSLFEAFFFLGCLLRLSVNSTVRRIARLAMFIVPWLWLGLMVIAPLLQPQFNQGSAIFDFIYEASVSFLSGFALLALAEKNERMMDLPECWILLAIFIYCFGTFFIMAFLKSFLSQRIWFINNIVNVISYALYAIGFYRLIANPSPEKN